MTHIQNPSLSVEKTTTLIPEEKKKKTTRSAFGLSMLSLMTSELNKTVGKAVAKAPSSGGDPDFTKLLELLRALFRKIGFNGEGESAVTAMLTFINEIIKIQAMLKSGKFSPAQKAQLEKLFKEFAGVASGHESLAAVMTKMMVYYYYILEKRDPEKAREDLQKILDALNKEDLTGNPFLQQLQKMLNYYLNQGGFNYFLQQHGKDSIEELQILLDGTGDEFFLENSSVGKLVKEMLLDEVDYLLHHVGNRSLLIAMLMAVLGQAMSDREQDLDGLGYISKALSELAKKESDIINQIAKGAHNGFTTKSLKHVLVEMKQILESLKARVKKFGGGTYDQIKSAFDTLLQFKVNGDALPNGVQNPTLEQIIDYIQSHPNFDANNVLTRAVNTLNIMFSKEHFNTQFYQEIMNAMNTSAKQVSDQSQSVQTQIAQMSGMIQQLTSVLKTTLVKDIAETWMATLVRNQKPA